ncbi:RDD family protein [Roseovarius amoyensis]|uniref:RDD family protein n=1 Tax=Roseovarius amoyensis TaxID=2211448 RepID=UPI000DBE93B2|nr:RDD family protein [Roseovarius amoyensis]
MTEPARPATWRRVVAFILDLVFSFFIIGYAVAAITGDTTEEGFSLTGFPAIVMFALWILYMAGMPRLGGRLFQRLLKAV